MIKQADCSRYIDIKDWLLIEMNGKPDLQRQGKAFSIEEE